MFRRRTLAAFLAVAALAGGASGALTSSATAPSSADAAPAPPRITAQVITTALQDPKIMAQIADADAKRRVDRIDASVQQLVATAGDLQAKADAITARTDDITASLTSLHNLAGRGPSGQSTGSLLQAIFEHLKEQ